MKNKNVLGIILAGGLGSRLYPMSSIGSKHFNQFTGTNADIGGFSLNRHKHIQTGEGGIIITNNKKLADIMFKIRNHGEVINKDNSFREERFKFDLHGFSLTDANRKVKEIIISCISNKYKEILLITGKGLHSSTSTNTYVSEDLSKLKYSVPEYIKNNDEINRYVVSISEASPKDGGSGAILIKLKNL